MKKEQKKRLSRGASALSLFYHEGKEAKSNTEKSPKGKMKSRGSRNLSSRTFSLLKKKKIKTSSLPFEEFVLSTPTSVNGSNDSFDVSSVFSIDSNTKNDDDLQQEERQQRSDYGRNLAPIKTQSMRSIGTGVDFGTTKPITVKIKISSDVPKEGKSLFWLSRIAYQMYGIIFLAIILREPRILQLVSVIMIHQVQIVVVKWQKFKNFNKKPKKFKSGYHQFVFYSSMFYKEALKLYEGDILRQIALRAALLFGTNTLTDKSISKMIRTKFSDVNRNIYESNFEFIRCQS